MLGQLVCYLFKKLFFLMFAGHNKPSRGLGIETTDLNGPQEFENFYLDGPHTI